jgi:hypothetical protein
MAKKKAPKRKKKAKRRPVTLTRYNILTTITIKTGNVIVDPDPLVCLPKGPVVWIVDNQDSVSHDVSIDPDSFRRKDNGKKENPLTKSSVLSTTVGSGGRDFMIAFIKGGLKKDGYYYSIASSNKNGTSIVLDPDLDVIDPNSLLPR